MRKGLKIGVIVAAIFFLFGGSAMAIQYTYPDVTDSWPGYTPYGSDSIGHPQIDSMVVTINDSTSFLESVVLNIANRVVPDSLFINTGGDGKPYEAWDFWVEDLTALTHTDGTLYEYEVGSVYEYRITTFPYRPDHPVGFLSGFTADTLGRLISVVGTASTLTYTFSTAPDVGIYMYSDFVIGYTPDCANDVILTPEPMSLLLLGLGLIGMAGIRRKF